MPDREMLSAILTGVVCGCCVLLCIVVSYLCVVVRRIRLHINDLSRDGNGYFEKSAEKANNNNKSEEKGEKVSAVRSMEPQSRRRQESVVFSNPCELVSYLKRDERPGVPNLRNTQALASACCTPNIEDVRMYRITKHLEYDSEDFIPEDGVPWPASRGKSSTAFPEQSIFTNHKVEYKKQGIDRCYTMDISQIF